jgi:8-oxo-dGTP pyrophosphatase MutT (NUDIX family)
LIGFRVKPHQLNDTGTTKSKNDKNLPRLAVRALIINPEGKVLLIQGRDSTNPTNTWWFTPGGGIEIGETPDQALIREVLEETGLIIENPVPLGRERISKFRFEDTEYFQKESFYLVRLRTLDTVSQSLTEIEKRTFLAQKWWSLEELSASSAIFYPTNLISWIEEILR